MNAFDQLYAKASIIEFFPSGLNDEIQMSIRILSSYEREMFPILFDLKHWEHFCCLGILSYSLMTMRSSTKELYN